MIRLNYIYKSIYFLKRNETFIHPFIENQHYKISKAALHGLTTEPPLLKHSKPIINDKLRHFITYHPIPSTL